MILKIKDLWTVGNIMGGVMCIIFVINHELLLASYSILAAYIFDATDGWVASLLKQSNKFGGEFDNVADLVAYSIAPTFLIYGVYTQHPVHPHLPMWLAVAIASLVCISGCVRFARFNLEHPSTDGYWLGFPRPASALLFIGYFNMSAFNSAEYLYWAGIALVVIISGLQLYLVPFYNHHRSKGHPYFMKLAFFVIGTSTALALIGGLIVGYSIVWEVITFWLLGYIFFHRYFSFSPEEKKEIKKKVEEWMEKEQEEYLKYNGPH